MKKKIFWIKIIDWGAGKLIEETKEGFFLKVEGDNRKENALFSYYCIPKRILQQVSEKSIYVKEQDLWIMLLKYKSNINIGKLIEPYLKSRESLPDLVVES